MGIVPSRSVQVRDNKVVSTGMFSASSILQWEKKSVIHWTWCRQMIKFNIMQPLKCCAYNLNSRFDNKYFIVSMKNCPRHDLAFMMRPGVWHCSYMRFLNSKFNKRKSTEQMTVWSSSGLEEVYSVYSASCTL